LREAEGERRRDDCIWERLTVQKKGEEWSPSRKRERNGLHPVDHTARCTEEREEAREVRKGVTL
jgi:hypothetical protein